MSLRAFVIFGLVAACAFSARASDGTEFFETKIRPLLVEKCYKCHSASAPKIKADLRLDNFEAMKRGGESGTPAVVPGKPSDSLLISAIKWEDDTLQMPPKNKLSNEQIALFEQWIKMGAPYPIIPATLTSAPHPVKMTLEEGKHFWSFIPPKEQKVPDVDLLVATNASSWVHNDIDRFILAKLKEKNLKPAPEADRRTLIRRATFDLTGLPPTAQEIEAFVNDPSPDAYEKVIDRLLASPRYGEKWARHWLDIARYADTKGYMFEEERRYPFSYTYRDWVIRAFNNDLPYDQFLIYQIAADRLVRTEDSGLRTEQSAPQSSVLRPQSSDLAALGFLTLGRRFIGNIHDIIDDRIDVVCKGTLGLTVTCARCHDHKYDPISQADYYSLYGIFASSTEPSPSSLPLLDKKPPSSPQLVEYQKALAAAEKERDDWIKAHQKDADAVQVHTRELQRKVDDVIVSHPGSPPRAMAIQDLAQPVDPYIFKRGNAANRGPAIPREFIEILSPKTRQPYKDSGRLALAYDIASKSNPLTARVMVNRIWQNHFSFALVRTPSDFGTRGEKPTHPELLDYLALKFENDGWSIKKIQKLIMLSATYRQASYGGDPNGEKIDPENRLLWHMNPRRIEWEELRDSVLFASGQLDLTMYGRPVDIFAQSFSHRRSIYAFIERQNLPGTFRTFDMASPDTTTAIRPNTSVPQQALFMMNNPFVIEQAKSVIQKTSRAHLVAGLAPRVPQSSTDETARVNALYKSIFARAPSPEETQLALDFIHNEKAEAPAPPPPKTQWAYGYGEFDEAKSRLKKFHPLPFFTGSVWQGGPNQPDPSTGWAMLTATGGHPGNDQAHAVVRRWTAPADCSVAIKGAVEQNEPQSDGIRARIVTTANGCLATWIIHTQKAQTNISPIAMKKGETIDFIVDCYGTVYYDSFGWKIQIDKLTGAAVDQRTWDAAKEFTGPAQTLQMPLNPWQRFAQVLLESNEFVFVD